MALIPLAVGLIVAGLLICYLKGSVGGMLSVVVYWVGVVLVIVGLVLLLAPVIVWLDHQIRMMIGS